MRNAGGDARAMSKAWTDNAEPSLDELIEDEVTAALLRATGRTVEALRCEMYAQRERLQTPRQSHAA